MVAIESVPLALRQIEQWHFWMPSSGPLISKRMPPQTQLP
jgi:hypothetical protein